MPPDEPSWWYATDGSGSVQQSLLAPAAWIYGRMAQRRFERRVPYSSRIPIVCIGNFTAGGTGKTPLTQAVGRLLQDGGARVVVLSRGYGGSTREATYVDAARHRAAEVGDEPLLMAQTLPVVISRDRRAGVQLIEAGPMPADVIIMDDGLQNPSVKKDLVIALVDGGRGVGNGAVIPAGPLRAPLDFQLGLADALVVNGRGSEAGRERAVLEQLRRRFPGPVLEASVAPGGDPSWLAGRPLFAYSGIGNPSRFFGLLTALGGDVIAVRTFGDHHQFKEREARDLVAEAEAAGAQLITTEKDWVRLSREGGALEELQSKSLTLPIRLTFDEADTVRLASLIEAAIKTGGFNRTAAQSSA